MGLQSHDQFGLKLEAGRTGNTAPQNPTARIDCLEFSVGCTTWEKVVKDFLRLDPSEFEHKKTSLRGFNYRVQRGHIQLLFDDACITKKVKVLISGQGIDELGVDALLLVGDVLANCHPDDGIKWPISQIHLAMDDRSELVTPKRVARAIKAGKAVTKFSDIRRISSFKFNSDSDKWYERNLPIDCGETWYFGSFRGDRLLRAYDKQKERIAAGDPDPGPWYRFEIQARNGYAMILAAQLMESGTASAGGILRGVLDFRQLDNERPIRRSVCLWWKKFTSGLEIVRTGFKQEPKTLEKIAKWLHHSVSRRLAEVRAILGDGWLNSLIKSGELKTDQGAIADMAREARCIPGFLGGGDLCLENSVYCPF